MASENVMVGRLPWLAADEADWDALYREQLPRVYNFFRYRVGEAPVAEDLTSLTFEKAWRSRYRYRRDLSAFTTWLFTIARNVAVDHFRARRDHVPLDEAGDLPAGETPEDRAVRRSDCERLLALLERLPERERELVALKYGADLSNRAIARTTGLSESNVGTILHRVIQDLRADW
jgi:RNA polymerase sigma-70 factor (ECF subfamily)